jgi:hypothetical protein
VLEYDASVRLVTLTIADRDTAALLDELEAPVDRFPVLMQVPGLSRLYPPESNDSAVDFEIDNVRLESDPRLRLRVTGVTWTNGNTSATVHYEANRPVQKYYYRLYQAQSTYQGTTATSAAFDGLGEGYYLFVVTARDANGALAAQPSLTWFFNQPTSGEFQVYLTSYSIADNDLTITYGATQPASRFYRVLLPVQWPYESTTDTAAQYTDLADGLYYFIVTGRSAADGEFPVGGPARQFISVTTAGF